MARIKALPGRGKAAKPLERDVQRACLDLLAVRGVYAWRQNSGAMKGDHKGKKWFVRFASVKGLSDIIGLDPEQGGRLVAVEVKRPGEKPTPEQWAFLGYVAANGGFATWVDDAGELDKHLAAARRRYAADRA